MRLLTYTKYLWRKVKFYDKLVNKTNSFLQNPFAEKDRTLTVIWVEDDEGDSFFQY